MPWETIKVRRTRTFIPPEVTRVANQLRAAAEKARELAEKCDSIQYELDETWEGKSQETFTEYREEQSNLLRKFSAELSQAADRVGAKEVTVWEMVEEIIWVPELNEPWK